MNGELNQVVVGVSEGRGLHDLAPLLSLKLDALTLDDDWSLPETRRMALGYLMGRYRFDRYKASTATPRLILPDGHDTLISIADAVTMVRDLVNTPCEHMGPDDLHSVVEELARDFDAQFNAVVGEQLLEQNYPAIHAVGRAASQAPRLLHLSWGDTSHPTLALVGKGVCFDCGGLNIKGASGMRLMKKDMGGAAHVIALARLIMQHKLPVRLEMLVPAVENAISSNAYRPGDVLIGRSGLTMEIGNTDAEGRVILSDALTRACELKPELLIDFATLTGAARVALGADLPPYFTNRDELGGALESAAKNVADPVWRLPLFDDYDDLISSPIADISNSGSTPMAGCITAALFLRRFVEPDLPWFHLDVYAWNPSERPGRPAGGEAHALRAMFEMLCNRYSQ